MDAKHINRVQYELRQAGVLTLGRTKFASSYLPNIIMPDEHIVAAVAGHGAPEHKWLSFEVSMLIATDQRMLFIDRQLGDMVTDEFAYDTITGVKIEKAGVFTDLTLHAGIGDIVINDVNPINAQRFVQFVEQKYMHKA